MHRTLRGLVLFGSRTGRVWLAQSLRVSLNIRTVPTNLEWLRGLNALRVLAQGNAAEQIVGPERRQPVSHQTWYSDGCMVTRRPVNSNVRRLMAKHIDRLVASEIDVESLEGKRVAHGAGRVV